MAARKTNIELLPQEDWEKRPIGKIIKWVLNVGRHIVIITELVVIVAFLARFKLDRDLIDLNEEIKQKQAIINSASKFENEFRFLQKRLKTIEGLRKNQQEADKIITEVANLIPVNVFLSNFTSTGEEASFTAEALNEAGLAAFLKNLEASPRFSHLNISQLSSGGSQEIKFELKSDLISNLNESEHPE